MSNRGRSGGVPGGRMSSTIRSPRKSISVEGGLEGFVREFILDQRDGASAVIVVVPEMDRGDAIAMLVDEGDRVDVASVEGVEVGAEREEVFLKLFGEGFAHILVGEDEIKGVEQAG
ncbi:MAG: hypothetical protein CME19_22225 [Gemmatimonadetes bacterium]|nr:hypothetical protein [Gemmatimonadota bacterium]